MDSRRQHTPVAHQAARGGERDPVRLSTAIAGSVLRPLCSALLAAVTPRVMQRPNMAALEIENVCAAVDEPRHERG
ncbi:hypothetical protein [Streptomyces sp. NBC_01727]|uniref:hypothetical protein n=1 Tax=Streptomyces sp. NBC_01727 TaxID=2975924 RepID=UPI002E14473F|nr:hypothetical protein OIE76_40855 [Streptomyces sp. NBC_01727]